MVFDDSVYCATRTRRTRAPRRSPSEIDSSTRAHNAGLFRIMHRLTSTEASRPTIARHSGCLRCCVFLRAPAPAKTSLSLAENRHYRFGAAPTSEAHFAIKEGEVRRVPWFYSETLRGRGAGLGVLGVDMVAATW